MKTNFKIILAVAALSISTASFAHTDNLNFSDSAYPVSIRIKLAAHSRTKIAIYPHLKLATHSYFKVATI